MIVIISIIGGAAIGAGIVIWLIVRAAIRAAVGRGLNW